MGSGMPEDIRLTRLIGVPVCWLLQLLVALSYWRFPPLRGPPSGLFLWRFGCQFVSGLTLLLGAARPDWEDEPALAAARDLAIICAILWTIAAEAEVSLVVWNPFKSYFKRRRQLHWFCWSTAFLVLVFWAGQYIHYRTHHQMNPDAASLDARATSEGIIPWVAVGMIALSLLLMVLVDFQLREGLNFSAISRARVTRQEVMLLVGFALMDATRVGVALVTRNDGSISDNMAYNVTNIATMALDTQIWLVATSAYALWADYCAGGAVVESDAHALEEELRHELILLTAVGITESCSQIRPAVGLMLFELIKASCNRPLTSSDCAELGAPTAIRELLFRNREAVGLSVLANLSASQIMACVSQQEDVDPTEGLRRVTELHASPSGLGETIKHVAARAVTGLVRGLSGEDHELVRSKTGLHIAEVQLGEDTINSRGSRTIIRIAASADPESGDFDFTNYRALLFEAVRRSLGVDPAQYESAFAEIVTFVKKDDTENTFEQSKMKEITSSGASGSYFYFSPNRRLIVKQVTKHEKDNLLEMSEAYLRHCCAHPDTMIHYYGCYSIKWAGIRSRTSRKMYFVVMKNFLSVAPSESNGLCRTPSVQPNFALTFDLKGATTNRRRLDDDELRQVEAGGEGRDLLDWDWRDLHCRLKLSDEAKSAMSSLVRRDSKFMASQNLLDYSLLLGVKHHAHVMPQPSGESHTVHGAAGEVSDLVGEVESGRETDPTAFCMGIIDALETWNCGWATQGKALACFLSMCRTEGDPLGITAIPPEQYALRFDEFINFEVLRFNSPTYFDDWRTNDSPTWTPNEWTSLRGFLAKSLRSIQSTTTLRARNDTDTNQS